MMENDDDLYVDDDGDDDGNYGGEGCSCGCGHCHDDENYDEYDDLADDGVGDYEHGDDEGW